MYLSFAYTLLFGVFLLGLLVIRLAARTFWVNADRKCLRVVDLILLVGVLVGALAQAPPDPAWSGHRVWVNAAYALTALTVAVLASAAIVGLAGYWLQTFHRCKSTAAAIAPVPPATPLTANAQTPPFAASTALAHPPHTSSSDNVPQSDVSTEPLAAKPVCAPETPVAVLDPSRRHWLRFTAAGALSMTTGIAVGGIWTCLKGLQIRDIPLRFPNLPPAFEGYRILQISDVHSGIFMSQAAMCMTREMVAQIPADLVVHTGDQVDYTPTELPSFLAAFQGLRGRDGVLAILGNHDYVMDAAAVRQGLEQAKIPVLVNESVRIRRGEQSLVVAGLDDIWGQYFRGAEGPQPLKALAGTTPQDFKIGLLHNPLCFAYPYWPRFGFDLTLTGHTHGGQINLLFDTLSPAHLLGPFVHGLYVRCGQQMYVNAGVGYVGLPIRIGVSPEVSVFTLMRGNLPPERA